VSGLQPWLRPYAEYLLQLASPYGVVVTSVFRSYSEQLELYRNRTKNPFPVAPPGQSYHQLGRAFDVSGRREVLVAMGQLWRSWGGTWSERDPIHFQA
jgi:hypothetical protein